MFFFLEKTLYRGLRSKRSLNITKGYFNTFMSASESLEEAQKFAGPNGSILYISSELGASIELFSIAPNEKEILFRPNILFAVDIVNSTNDKIFLVTLLENSASLSHSPVTFVVLLLNVKNLW